MHVSCSMGRSATLWISPKVDVCQQAARQLVALNRQQLDAAIHKMAKPPFGPVTGEICSMSILSTDIV